MVYAAQTSYRVRRAAQPLPHAENAPRSKAECAVLPPSAACRGFCLRARVRRVCGCGLPSIWEAVLVTVLPRRTHGVIHTAV
jgi:hypothetical protein